MDASQWSFQLNYLNLDVEQHGIEGRESMHHRKRKEQNKEKKGVERQAKAMDASKVNGILDQTIQTDLNLVVEQHSIARRIYAS